MSRRRAMAVLLGLGLGLGLLGSTATAAAPVYRWVDEQGKVHYSEVVPERYRRTAKPVDTAAGQGNAEQQREALERAEKARARAAAGMAGSGGPPASAAAAAAPASRPAAKRPARVPNERTDCETWERLYLESRECFGPFRNARGGIKPEAFEVCQEVPEPPSRCRPRVLSVP